MNTLQVETGEMFMGNTKTERWKRWKKRQRKAIYLAYGGMCVYCGQILSIQNFTLDHKYPKSKGGTRRRSNLVLSCQPCNQEKGSTSYNTFLIKKTSHGKS